MTHSPQCDWHADQYDFECTCGASYRAAKAEIARQREVIETWADIDRKSSARIEVLERALRELLEASEMNERDLELCEYETIMEDAQTRARELLS